MLAEEAGAGFADALGGGAAQPAGAPLKSHFEISVREPVKQGDGINAFIRYKIVSKCDLAGRGEATVERRYSDWSWLHNQLQSSYLGVILPALPDKALVGRFDSEFIEARRKQLETYLQQVAAHPMLFESQELKTFLEQAEDIDQSKGNKDAAAAASKKSNLFGMFKELQVSAQIGLSQSGWIKQDISLPHDVQCAEMRAYLNALDTQLQSVQKFSDKMVSRHRDLATSLSEFGLAVSLLGNCETDTQYLASGLSQLGNSCDRLSIIHHEQADAEAERFEGRIRDYIRTVACAKEAIKGREKALLSYQTALTSLEAKKQKLIKAQQQAPPNPGKVADAEKEVQQAEEEVSKTREAHEAVSEVTRKEMARFQREKVDYFKSMVVEYVKLQIDHSKKVQGVWEGLLPEVEAIQNAE